MEPPLPPGTGIVLTFGPLAATGGLVGYNTGFVISSFSTGPVTSDSSAGGLVGFHQSKLISGSYATGPVSGSPAGGLVGTIATPRAEATIRASYATGSVDGGTAGGLVGRVYNKGTITASYATGRVAGSRTGGLVGRNERGTVTNSYWDTSTSGHTSGSPGSGRTTSQLQSPRSYSGIYASWNVDLEGDGSNDDPWNFGTTSQYPALKADMDGDDDATWEEFGYQIRSGPTLTATATMNAGQSQVELEWTEVPLSSEWTPAPGVSYTVTREDDEDLETIAENLTALEYTDTDVAGETYIYQVVAVVDGGEAARSATVSVTVAGNKRPVAVGRLRWRVLLVGDSAMTEVGGAFEDPEGDTITYAVSSSDTSVARVTLSGTRVTIIPVAEGRAIITVTATDDGSNRSRTQRFWVTVRPTTTVDYDTDDDGLIEIGNLAQLDAVRYDLTGDGFSYSTAYAEAFTDGGGGSLACGGLLGCVGYELNADLDFDTDGSGEADAGDTYWNSGAGWVPIGDSSDSFSSFAAIFEGNGRTITNLFIDSSENDIGLFGATRSGAVSSTVIRNLEMVSVQVTGTDNVGGLVGSNGGAVSGSYATGKVSGDDDVGGLVGANLDDGSVSASYSAVQVTGDDRIGGLAGASSGEVTATHATGRVVGDFEAGGLIGRNSGDVNVSYATALVSGRSTIGGLIGWNASGGTVTDSFWDSDTSGRTTGFSGQAKTTAELQLPTAASGIYSAWNLDLDGDGMNDDPWDFGTSSQYPVLSVDTNGVGGATWQEFGQQVQTSPALMPTTALGQVTLTWSVISGGTYNLFRTSGTTVEILTENTANRTYVDTDVTAGATYVYQVAAVINGGEASRSPRVSVVVPMMGTLPTVTLQLMPTAIGENRGSATVTARLSLASTETTTVTVSAAAVSPAVEGDFRLSTNTTLTITAGQTSSTGTVTITANNNNVDAPSKTVMVMGTANNSGGVTGPSNVTLNIIDDDDPPTVTLELMPASIDENGGSTTVTARLSHVSTETTTVAVSATAVSPAVAGDFALSSNKTLTITAGQTGSTGTVTITANDNDTDTPGNTVRVSGTASNRLGVTNPADVTLTLTDDDDPPTVLLLLSAASIGENGGSATVTARLNRVSSETTTVTVFATAVSPAVSRDFALSSDRTLTITAGQTSSSGTVTITANDNDADTPDNTVRVSGTADNSHGVTDPDEEELTITDDDDPPTVMLLLSRTSISENNGSTTVTARLDRTSSETTTVTVSAMAVSPAVAEDFTLSTNKTLTITGGQTTSTGTVTITANNNIVDTLNKTVRVSATADNSHGATDPDDEDLTITDDDAAPAMTLEVSPAVIAEAAGNSTVTVRIANGVTFAEDQEIRLSLAGTAEKGTDYTVGLERLTLVAGQSSVDTTVTAVDDAIDDDAETIRVTARHGGGVLGAERTIAIADDDASPVIVTRSPILVEENETAVATLTARDADRPVEDLTWRITGGADRNRFRLTADGALTFSVAQDFEAPGDSDRDGDYEVTSQVSDGFNPVEAVLTVRLQDVDDTAPALSSASVNGATLTLTYGEALDGSSRPAAGDFTVAGGNSARTVSNVAMSGRAVTLTLDPAVEHGETGIRVSYRPGANPIQDAEGNDAARLSNEPVTNNTGDTTAPAVSRVEITSRPERHATYAAGQEIAVTVTFSETVVVTGTPRLRLNVGGVDRTANYRSQTGAAVLFVYRVADGESDADGVSIAADSVTGTIRDGADNNAVLTHDGLAADAGHKVDGVKPVFESASVNGATLTLTYGEALDGRSTPVALAFTVNVAGSGRAVSRVAVSGSAVTLTLEPEVGVGQAVRITYRTPGANPIQDAVGNDARPLTNRAVENNTLDTTAPRVSRVAIASNPGRDGIYAEGDVMEVTVTFSETVQVDTANGTPTLALRVGRPTRPATYDRGSNSDRLVFSYMVADGDIDTDGVSIAAGRIALNGGTINDFADNPAVLAYETVPPQPGHAVDGVRPALQGAAVSGDTLTLTYNEALDEDSTPAADDFTVDVASAERRVVEILVNGSTVTLTLVSEVTPGETVTVSYTAGTRPIRDAAGNAADDLTEYKVGTPPPFVPPPPPPPTPQPPSPGGGGGGGGGRARPPSYPGIIRAEGGDGEVTLTWDAPSSRGSSRIEHYEYRIDGEGEWISTGSSDRTHAITGLIAGRIYFFHLRAVSAAGAGSHRISPEATPVADLDFTHFANGGFITSTLALVNAGAYPVRPAIYFYDQDGDPIAARRVVELTPDLEVGDDGALRPRTVMHPLEELTIATHGRGGLRAGSVTVRAPGSIGGFLRFDIPGHGVAGVGDSPTLRDALVPVRRQDGGINTGVAVRNRGTATLKVECRLMRDGAVLEETIIPLPANGQDSRFIDQVFPAADTSDFAGSVRCTAPEPGRFSAVAFELDGVNRIFTTLPVVPVPAVLEQEQEEEPEQEQEQQQDATRLDFTHFANGGKIVSSLVLLNAGTDPVRPAIYFHDRFGGPIAAESMLDITGDLEVGDDGALRPGTAIDPLGELTISTHGRGALKVGSVAVTAEGPIGGVLRFDIPALGVAGVGDSPPVRDALVPVRRQDGGVNTGVAVHNRGAAPLLVRCRLMRAGAVLEETMIPLAANGQDSRFIDQVFPTADTSDFAGSVRCMTPEPGRFSAVAFELDGVHRIFTTLPVVPVVEVP